tara:strand:- start:334 stop:603 length:270 start_codon:yes stop_codon:yes gene_type:complete
MSLFKDLYKYKRIRKYDVKKEFRDERLYLGYDYSQNLIKNSISKHILRNETVKDFIEFCTDYYMNTIKQIRSMKNWKNFTVKKEDKNIR